jgi:hypothetical protein
MPYTLRAVLRTFKFIPDEFVEPSDEQINTEQRTIKKPHLKLVGLYSEQVCVFHRNDYSPLPCGLPFGFAIAHEKSFPTIFYSGLSCPTPFGPYFVRSNSFPTIFSNRMTNNSLQNSRQ